MNECNVMYCDPEFRQDELGVPQSEINLNSLIAVSDTPSNLENLEYVLDQGADFRFNDNTIAARDVLFAKELPKDAFKESEGSEEPFLFTLAAIITTVATAYGVDKATGGHGVDLIQGGISSAAGSSIDPSLYSNDYSTYSEVAPNVQDKQLGSLCARSSVNDSTQCPAVTTNENLLCNHNLTDSYNGSLPLGQPGNQGCPNNMVYQDTDKYKGFPTNRSTVLDQKCDTGTKAVCTTAAYPTSFLSDWMSLSKDSYDNVDPRAFGDKPLNQIFMHGTHDTMTYDLQTNKGERTRWGPDAKTQVEDINNMAGVERLIDITFDWAKAQRADYTHN